MLLDIERVDEPVEAFLSSPAAATRVVRRFGERRDSRSVVLGVEHAGRRLVVKASLDHGAAGWLRSAVELHGSVAHPAIVPLLHRFETPTGLALVYPWVDGEVLRDGFDPSVPDLDSASSPMQRFLRLSVVERVDAVRHLIDAHVAVAARGYVAVDLYDGCVIYDPDRRRLHLIDLDHYRRGPYVLEHDRQLGSSSFMAPEEHQRGATIDERTTVFTLGRLGLVLLGCARRDAAARADFAGTDEQWELLTAATRPDPSDRIRTVSELSRRWG